MANILLGVTGSVAAIRTPALVQALTGAGHQVKTVATRSSLFFFEPFEIALAPGPELRRDPEKLILDEDEWPGHSRGRRYLPNEPVLHIELRKWAELLLIAPLDANTLAKLANGICDNCLTCVWRAWNLNRQVILAPAMNTLMWDHPLTMRHLRVLAEINSPHPVPAGLTAEELSDWINRNCPKLQIVGPIIKTLACGDIGIGAMSEVNDLVGAVNLSIAANTLQ